MAMFSFDTVAARTFGGACLVLDKNSNPHIAYAGDRGHLMLTTRDVNGGWIYELVPGKGLVGGQDSRVCLQIDSEGNPHIAFYDYDSDRLIYRFKRNYLWEETPIPTSRFGDPRGVSGFDFRLHSGRINPELRDTPYFTFHDLTTNSLGFTRKVAGQFKRILLIPEDNVWNIGKHPSMVFEGDYETLLIAYIEELEDYTANPPHTRVRVTRIDDPSKGIVGFTSLLESGRFKIAGPTSITGATEWCVAYDDQTNRKLKASVFDLSLTEIHNEIVTDTVFPVVPSVARDPMIRGGYRIAFSDATKTSLN
ncbi:hypothetical protein [Peribacillus sp. FSL R5-0717]|uniref:hypothetical protein n=1 Tax=Peribacillus sp. FSL R5-0717 TaxID=2975308 RepID=UPI0030F8F3C1